MSASTIQQNATQPTPICSECDVTFGPIANIPKEDLEPNSNFRLAQMSTPRKNFTFPLALDFSPATGLTFTGTKLKTSMLLDREFHDQRPFLAPKNSAS